jgi:hypothetical protein
MNKFLCCSLFCVAIFSISHSSEIIEYCFVKNSQKNHCFNIKALNYSIIDTIRHSSSRKLDSIKCSGFFDFERKDVFYFNKTLNATYTDYNTRGCLGFGGSISCLLSGEKYSKDTLKDFYKESSGVPCQIGIKSEIIIANPNEFTACENCCLQNCKEKDALADFKIEEIFGRDFLVEWKAKIKCEPIIDTTYSGFYHIHITGECP